MINRAIDEQTLVGNIGGYLGLFLGYSILQLPSMIQILSLKIKENYRHFKSGNRLKKIMTRKSLSEKNQVNFIIVK